MAGPTLTASSAIRTCSWEERGEHVSADKNKKEGRNEKKMRDRVRREREEGKGGRQRRAERRERGDYKGQDGRRTGRIVA